VHSVPVPPQRPCPATVACGVIGVVNDKVVGIGYPGDSVICIIGEVVGDILIPGIGHVSGVVIRIVDKKPSQNLQAAKQDGLMQLQQYGFSMNDVVCVSQIDFCLLLGFNNLQTL
jgi:hypothetical protein